MECTKREEVMEDLNTHIEMAHNFAIRHEETKTKKIEARARLIEAKAKKINAENAGNATEPTDEI